MITRGNTSISRVIFNKIKYPTLFKDYEREHFFFFLKEAFKYLWDCLQIDDKKEFVENLYESKWINMWELLESLTLVEAQKIYEHEKFQCLKALTNE